MSEQAFDPSSRTSEDWSRGDRIRILYVEDDRDFADLAVTCLEAETDRFSIETAADAVEGLERLDEDVDCIVSDYNMPGMNGIEFLTAVRESHPGLPFILFTGRGSEEIASDAISAGVTDYLQKEGGTDQFTVLANRIVNSVEKDRAEATAERKTTQLETVLSHSPIILFALDGDGTFTLSRGEGLRNLGFEAGEVVGDSVFDVFADSADIVAAVEDALDGKQTAAVHEVGGAVYETTYNPVFDDDGSVSTVIGVAHDVTERHEREQELRQFEQAIEATSHSVYITDTDGTIEYVNPAFERTTGYTAREAIGQTPRILKSGEHDEEFYEELWGTILSGDTWQGELVNSTNGGDRYVVDQTITPVTDDAGEITNFVAVNRDITDRKQRQRRFRALVEESNDVISVLDSDGVFQYNSPSIERILGHDPEETVGDTAWEYIHPDDREAVMDTFEEWVTDPGSTATVEYRARHADGSWRWMEARGTSQRDNPAVDGHVVNSRDITDRKERERQSRRERQRYATLFETLPTPVLHARAVDGEPIVRTVNSAFEETFGYDAETITGEPLHECILPEDRTEAAEGLNRQIIEEGEVRTEIRRETTDGVRTFQLDCRVRNPESERPEGYAVYTDITDRKEYERELEIVREAVENAHIPLVLTDPTREDNPLVYVNEAFEQMTGYSRSEAVGRNCRFLQGEETDPDQVAKLRKAIDNEEQVTVELRNYRKDGEMFWNRVTLRPIYDEDGNLIRYFGSQEDVTERKAFEERLQRQNERLDEFARVVSHDLQNPLRVAEGRLALAGEECDSEHLEAVADAIDRSRRLIDDLLTLARNGVRVEETEPVDLAATVRNCREIVESGGATLAVETDRTITADRSRLQQLLENLLRNAVEHGSTSSRPGADDAVEHGGEHVHVTVGELDGRPGFYVEDDGPGVPVDERERVFESGYSTADDGTGFGLAIVDEITREHGWDIRVTESRAGGARFEVTGVEFVDG